MVNLLFQIKRVWVELTLLALVGVALFYMPPIEKQGLELFLYKILLFSGSQLHALILRTWMYPYINFRTAVNPYHLITVIALHLGAAYVYGVGG